MFYLKQAKLFELLQLNKKNPLQKNNNLIKIICNIKLIKNIFFRMKCKQKSFIIKNKVINKINLEILKNLNSQIETGNYKWINNIKVNNEYIFHFKNQIVQKLIELILITIYEPVFQALEYNHGFRYKKSPQIAIQRLKAQNQKLTYGLKNKIKKNYKTINKKLFIKILKKKIIDLKFLTLIKNWVKNKTKNFLLYNIYTHEFDLFISKKIKMIKRIELDLTQVNLEKFELYPKSVINLFNAKQQILKAKTKNIQKLSMKKFQKLKKNLKMNKRKQIQHKIQNKRKKHTQIIYNRYNDNWILLTNYGFYKAESVKNTLIKWLKRNLEINWNQILTINLIKKKLNYLGFIFFTMSPKIKKIYYRNKIQTKRKKKIILFIGINCSYIRNKLVKKGFITPNNKPIHMNIYFNLKPFQILKKFEQNLKILVQYYYNLITHKNDLNYYYYLYKFSYLKTMAYKMKKSITYISMHSLKNLKKWKLEHSQVERHSFLVRLIKSSNLFVPNDI